MLFLVGYVLSKTMKQGIWCMYFYYPLDYLSILYY